MQYSDTEKGLIIADPFTTQVQLDKKNTKASLVDTTDLLAQFLTEPKTHQDLLEILTDQLDCGKRTFVIRLKQIIDSQIPIMQNGVNHSVCTRTDGKELIYSLTPTKSSFPNQLKTNAECKPLYKDMHSALQINSFK